MRYTFEEMQAQEIAFQRLQNQQIVTTDLPSPEAIVSALGALQAQDYPGALWAIGLRLPGATLPDIEEAIAQQKIVRTWPMRGTLHFVAAADVRWMLQLLAPRILTRSAGRHKSLELDEHTLAKSGAILHAALHGGKQRTRSEVFAALEKAGIPTAGQRGAHILGYAAMNGLICFGPMQGKQQTFTLLEEWVPVKKSKKLSGDEALAEITRRYLRSHGPAQLQDLMWWAGLRKSEAQAGIAAIKSELVSEQIYGQEYWVGGDHHKKPVPEARALLLPGFDEYLLGYRDRRAVLDIRHAQKVCPGGNGMFRSTVVLNGKVSGIWRRTFDQKAVRIEFEPFTAFTKAQKAALIEATARYEYFLKRPVILSKI